MVLHMGSVDEAVPWDLVHALRPRVALLPEAAQELRAAARKRSLARLRATFRSAIDARPCRCATIIVGTKPERARGRLYSAAL
jgi:hypothetical protein